MDRARLDPKVSLSSLDNSNFQGKMKLVRASEYSSYGEPGSSDF